MVSAAGSSKSYPLFMFLLITNLLGALASLFVGAWLVDASKFPSSLWETMDVLDETDVGLPMDDAKKTDVKDKVKEICLLALINGILAILFSFLLLWNAIDILVLMTSAGENVSPIKSYRSMLRDEMGGIVDDGTRESMVV